MELREPLAEGASAQIFPWGEGKIIKLLRPSVPAALIDSEYRIDSIIHSSGLNAPAALQRVEVDGRPGIVYSRASGTTMWFQIATAPHKSLAFARTLARLHADVHGHVGHPDLPDVNEELRRRIEVVGHAPPRVRQSALEGLEKLPRGDRLLHGDFHPGNVVTSRDRAVIIDWADAARGHPLADVAKTCLLICAGVLPRSPLRRMFASACREVFCRVYLHAYFRRSPYRAEDLQPWLSLMSFIGLD
jgi:aminoglycoside phosphotransferase (APT) family kinase protein